jgi:outer membrane protein assembly factor BamE (lipoprotein component of BamABCDE complex)
MKTMRAIAFGVAVFLIAGCTTTFKPWKLSEIQEGMEKDQVVQILGNPDFSLNKDGAEYLYYTYQEELSPISDVSLESAQGIERRVEEFNRTLNEYKYEVMIVDGRVVNYKEMQD